MVSSIKRSAMDWVYNWPIQLFMFSILSGSGSWRFQAEGLLGFNYRGCMESGMVSMQILLYEGGMTILRLMGDTKNTAVKSDPHLLRLNSPQTLGMRWDSFLKSLIHWKSHLVSRIVSYKGGFPSVEVNMQIIIVPCSRHRSGSLSVCCMLLSQLQLRVNCIGFSK